MSTPTNIIQRARLHLWRRTLALLKARPSSHPYISGDGFRSLARHRHEKGSRVRPNKVRRGDIVFVQSDMINEFFSTIHPQIANGYVLITHNGDTNILNQHLGHIDDKVIHWFAQNLLVEHPKVTPIPIGLENASYANAGRKSLFQKRDSSDVRKNGRILVSFTRQTNPTEREVALDILKENPRADLLEKRLSQEEYAKIVPTYSFVASPPGNGEDCHRTWEALYLGTTPIVKASVCMEYFRNLGLGLAVIESWDETHDIQPLAEAGRADRESPLFLDYWKSAIEAKAHE